MDSLNNTMNKFRGFFTKAQKEIFRSGEGKRNLYFDYNRKYFIKFALDVQTTCDTIFKIHKEKILSIVRTLYQNEDINLNDFAFFIIELNSNKFDGTQNLINIKLRMDDNNINRILLNSQFMICYLKMNKQNLEFKKQMKNKGLLNPINYEKMEGGEKEENIENVEKQDKKKSKTIKTYISKGNVRYYNYKDCAFSKEKITITEKDIFISSSPNYKLEIKEIKTLATFLSTEGKDIIKYLKYYKIVGDKPIYCLEIEPKIGKKLLIGKNKYDSFMVLYKALESSINNYQNYICHLDFRNKIFQYYSNLICLSNCILRTTSSIDELVINKAKRKILFKDFKYEELVNIVNNIMDFKNNFFKMKYIESINNIKNLINTLDKILQEKKFPDVINEDNTEYIKNILNKINELHLLDNESNKTNKNQINNSVKNVPSKKKENTKSDITVKNKEQNKIKKTNNEVKNTPRPSVKKAKIISEEQIKGLNNIINIHIFDPLFTEIKQKYISEFYEQKKDNKNKNSINNSLKLILGNFISNNLGMKEEKDILYLGGDELDKTINDFNEELIAERLKIRRVK